MAGKSDFTLRLGLEGMATIVTGVNQLWSLMSRVGRVIRQQAQQVQEYSRAVDGHAVSVTRADEATAGLIDTIQLHRQAARLERAGMQISERQYAALTVAALDYARATGTDATEAMQNLTQAVITGSSEGLRPYGIQVNASMTLEERRAAVLQRVTERVGDQTRSVRDLGEAIYRLQNNAGTAWSELMRTMMDESGPVMAMLNEMSDALGRLAEHLQASRERRALAGAGSRSAERSMLEEQLIAAGVDLSSGQLDPLRAESVGGLRGGLQRGIAEATGGLLYGRSAARRTAALQRMWERYQALGESGEANAASDAAARRALEQQRAAARGASVAGEEIGGGGGRSGRGAWGMSEAQRVAAEAAAMVERALREVDERRTEWEEQLGEQRIEMIGQMLEAEMSLWQKAEDDRTRYAEMMAERREEIAREEHEAKVGLAAAEEKFAAEDRKRLTDTSDVIGGMVGLFGELGRAVSEMAGEHAAATKAIAAVEGAFLVAYNVSMAVTDFADAVKAFASQNYAKGALMIIAGATHISAAVTAAAKLGASLAGVGEAQAASGKASGGKTRQSERPEYWAPPDRQEQGERTTVFNFNGPVTSRRAQEDLWRMRREDARRND